MWLDTMDSISSNEEKWRAGYFVKATKTKVFTGKIIKDISDLMGCGNYNENYEVLVSEPFDIKAEWRCFITYDKLIDVRPYGMIAKPDNDSYYYTYDSKVLKQMMEVFVDWEDRPASCSMDICVTSDGSTLLVECNDSYALGCYGLSSLFYAKMILARWSQLLGVEDEFHF